MKIEKLDEIVINTTAQISPLAWIVILCDKINEIIEHLSHKEEEKAKLEQFDPQDTMMPDY